MLATNTFKCSANEEESIPESILKELGISYVDINSKASNIANLSKAIKGYRDLSYCRLPFCSTVEAESFGSKVVLDHQLGNRISQYAIEDINSINKLKEIDLTKGRIAEVLKAVSILKELGEYIILDVTGPITIGTSIMNNQLFFKATRKTIDNNKLNQLLKLIEDSIVAYILEGVKRGVDIFSFADPAGSIDIVGPRVYKGVSGKSIHNILKKLEGKLGSSTIHLCGKTSTSLEAVRFLKSENVIVEGEDYIDMIENIKKEDIHLIGNWCLKLKKTDNIINKCILI